MNARSVSLPFVACALLVCTSATAAPQSPVASLGFVPAAGPPPDALSEPAPAPNAVPARDVVVVAHGGAFAGTMGGVVVGATGLARFGLFQAGGLVEGGTSIFSGSYVAVAAASGLAVRTPSGFRLDLLGVAGDHHYTAVGAGLLTTDPGAHGDTPFVGARLGLSYGFGVGATRFDVGAWGLVEDDLTRSTQTYSFAEQSWFGGGTFPRTVTHTVGGYRAGAALRLGAAFDL